MADTPFGLSFGNPHMYMGKSPLAEIGKAAKTGLMITALQKSGAIDALDKFGVKANKDGGFGFNNAPKATPAGAIAPGIQGTSAALAGGFGPAVPPQNAAMSSGAPMVPAATNATPEQVAPQPEVDFDPPPAPDAGHQILDNVINVPVSDVSNKMDFNPSAQQTGYNQMLATGNEYQQAPGYGKIAKTLQTMFGMG
jgi:hypothetical protein